MYIGRYAPSPSGYLHYGNFFAACMAYARARRENGLCYLRIEDLDRDRHTQYFAQVLQEDLHWLGFRFDAFQGEAALFQSTRHEAYEAAILKLSAEQHLYACQCSRRDIAQASQAPSERTEHQLYTGQCRDKKYPYQENQNALRLQVNAQTITSIDCYHGTHTVMINEYEGDVLLKRKNGDYAYHLAVVVDDAYQSITEIVRACDLRSSAPIHLYLASCLHLPLLRFAHIPLLCDSHGQKLSKRDKSESIRKDKEAGCSAVDVHARLLHMLSPYIQVDHDDNWTLSDYFIFWQNLVEQDILKQEKIIVSI